MSELPKLRPQSSKCSNPDSCKHYGDNHLATNCPKTTSPICILCSRLNRPSQDHITSAQFFSGKCDSRWAAPLGNDGQPLILKSTMYLCLLKFALLNPRSTPSKSSFKLDTIFSIKLDIIALTETWISENADNVTKYDSVSWFSCSALSPTHRQMRRKYFCNFQKLH